MNNKASPYLDFAENLRTMSVEKSSIAQVCRDLGMNRQQFNKYLSGTNLPGPATLEKISRYFDVDQRAMFVSSESNRGKRKIQDVDPLSMLSQLDKGFLVAIAESLAGSRNAQLQEGCYFIYYSVVNKPTDIIRAMMIVFKVGEMTCFRRYTKVRMKGETDFRFALSRHEGIVIERSGRTFLLARNTKGFGEISLLSFGALTSANFGTMAGLALVFTPHAEPMATRVTISYLGTKKDFRRGLNHCGIIPADTQEIPDSIKQSVLDPVDFSERILMPFGTFDDPKP